MATSPLDQFADVTLTFKRPVDPAVINETGNFEATGETYWVKCTLEEVTEVTEKRPGEELATLDVEGTITSSQDGSLKLPADIQPGARADVSSASGVVNGIFTLKASLPQGYGVDEILGYPIKGTISMRINRGVWT